MFDMSYHVASLSQNSGFKIRDSQYVKHHLKTSFYPGSCFTQVSYQFKPQSSTVMAMTL